MPQSRVDSSVLDSVVSVSSTWRHKPSVMALAAIGLLLGWHSQVFAAAARPPAPQPQSTPRPKAEPPKNTAPQSAPKPTAPAAQTPSGPKPSAGGGNAQSNTPKPQQPTPAPRPSPKPSATGGGGSDSGGGQAGGAGRVGGPSTAPVQSAPPPRPSSTGGGGNAGNSGGGSDRNASSANGGGYSVVAVKPPPSSSGGRNGGWPDNPRREKGPDPIVQPMQGAGPINGGPPRRGNHGNPTQGGGSGKVSSFGGTTAAVGLPPVQPGLGTSNAPALPQPATGNLPMDPLPDAPSGHSGGGAAPSSDSPNRPGTVAVVTQPPKTTPSRRPVATPQTPDARTADLSAGERPTQVGAQRSNSGEAIESEQHAALPPTLRQNGLGYTESAIPGPSLGPKCSMVYTQAHVERANYTVVDLTGDALIVSVMPTERVRAHLQQAGQNTADLAQPQQWCLSSKTIATILQAPSPMAGANAKAAPKAKPLSITSHRGVLRLVEQDDAPKETQKRRGKVIRRG